MNQIVGAQAPGIRGLLASPNSEHSDFDIKSETAKWSAFLFFPAAFSKLCLSEIWQFNEQAENFAKFNCRLIGVSTDEAPTLKKWITTPKEEGGVLGITFPLLSDSEGFIAKSIGALDHEKNLALRAFMIVDEKGIVQHLLINNLNQGRNAREALRTLQALNL